MYRERSIYVVGRGGDNDVITGVYGHGQAPFFRRNGGAVSKDAKADPRYGGADDDRKPVDLRLEGLCAASRDFCSRVVSRAREPLGSLELGPRACGAPDPLIAVGQVESDAEAGCQSLTFGELPAGVRVLARVEHRLGRIEEGVRIGQILLRLRPRGSRSKDCGSYSDDGNASVH
jgi:hypothetical protein